MRHHKYENNHPGIDKTFLELKQKYYYPNLKKEITKVINNCDICNYKIERRPLKLPFEKTETPSSPHEIYHTDIWYMDSKNSYITLIDKFSKYALIQKIEERTPLNLIKHFTILFNLMKTPKKLILDNEPGFTSSLFKDFLERNNIEFHFTTPYRHTGNSDIERFHSNLNENIRILRKREETSDIVYNVDLPIQANFIYNNTFHLTIRRKPVEIHFSSNPLENQKIRQIIEERKEKNLAYLNKNRKDQEVNENFKKDFRAYKIDARHEKVTLKKIDDKNYQNKNQRVYKDQLIRARNTFRSLDVLVDPTDNYIEDGISEDLTNGVNNACNPCDALSRN